MEIPKYSGNKPLIVLCLIFFKPFYLLIFLMTKLKFLMMSNLSLFFYRSYYLYVLPKNYSIPSLKIICFSQEMVAHASSQEAEASESL